ncbi:MAG: hypothetical protein KC550_02405, partial [Nanoarchaeota archaeon]|nr:hypothetical protein [Nanoarchaeota archaeon]
NGIDCSVDNLTMETGANNISIPRCLSTDAGVVKVVLYGKDTIAEKKFYFEGRPFICFSTPPQGFHDGDGSLADPFQICDCEQLQNMSNNLNSNFSLIKDINCSDTINWNSGAGFIPIGTFPSHFKGSLNGQNYTIKNLFINKSGFGVGLIGSMQNGNITDLGLTNITVFGGSQTGGVVGLIYQGLANNILNVYTTGKITSSGTSVGGIVGESYGGGYPGGIAYIDNAYSLANITGTDNAGGLVGFYYSGGDLTKSYFSGKVNGTTSVGGLVGKFQSGGKVENSYSKGIVFGTGNDVGGLIGKQFIGKINDSFSSANVSGNTNVGGLIGYTDDVFSYSEVKNSYSTGNVTGSVNLGGLIGRNHQGTITNSYWNNHSANPSKGIGLDDFAQTTTAIADNEVYFYNQSSSPMDLWNSSIWVWSGSDFPILN